MFVKYYHHRRARRGGGRLHGLKNFQGKLCFQGKSKLLKNPECKKYIQYSENFQGNRKLLENPECKKYIQYSAKFHGKLCFSVQAQVAQKSGMYRVFHNC